MSWLQEDEYKPNSEELDTSLVGCEEGMESVVSMSVDTSCDTSQVYEESSIDVTFYVSTEESNSEKAQESIRYWEQVISAEDTWKYVQVYKKEIRKRIFAHVPYQIRPTLWKILTHTSANRESKSGLFSTLLSKGENKSSDQIRLDLDRTLIGHPYFKGNTKSPQNRLFNVLNAYAHYNATVGYCQGMASVVGCILTLFEDDEDVFWVFVAAMERHSLTQYYSNDMSGLIRDAFIFEKMLEIHNKSMYDHLQAHNISSLMYLAPWWLTLYCNLPVWNTVLRFMDIFFIEGTKGLMRISLGILDSITEDCLQLNGLDQLLPYLLKVPTRKLNDDGLITIARNVPVFKLFNQVNKKYNEQIREQESSAKEARSERDKNAVENKKFSRNLMRGRRKSGISSSTNTSTNESFGPFNLSFNSNLMSSLENSTIWKGLSSTIESMSTPVKKRKEPSEPTPDAKRRKMSASHTPSGKSPGLFNGKTYSATEVKKKRTLESRTKSESTTPMITRTKRKAATPSLTRRDSNTSAQLATSTKKTTPLLKRRDVSMNSSTGEAAKITTSAQRKAATPLLKRTAVSVNTSANSEAGAKMVTSSKRKLETPKRIYIGLNTSGNSASGTPMLHRTKTKPVTPSLKKMDVRAAKAGTPVIARRQVEKPSAKTTQKTAAENLTNDAETSRHSKKPSLGLASPATNSGKRKRQPLQDTNGVSLKNNAEVESDSLKQFMTPTKLRVHRSVFSPSSYHYSPSKSPPPGLEKKKKKGDCEMRDLSIATQKPLGSPGVFKNAFSTLKKVRPPARSKAQQAFETPNVPVVDGWGFL